MTVTQEIFDLFEKRGREAYFGEDVSVLEHSLQAADLARKAGAADSLIVAAILHDIGHLLHSLPEDVANDGIDARHEFVGEAWLRARFPASVTEPVRLHVEAKRYLCRTDPEYLSELSPSSVRSLELQGGPHTASEASAFESRTHYRDAVALRRWDDTAKTPGLPVPALDSYRDLLDSHSIRA